MNQVLVDNHNKIVDNNDDVWFIGDLAFGKHNVIDVLNKMNGRIHFIFGGHDAKYSNIIKKHYKVEYFGNIETIKYNKQLIVLCHYALRTWQQQKYGAWHLFGHSHGTLQPYGLSLDIGVDCNKYKPVSFKEIKEILK
jgi:calcineurin-like phosphoesterase family protein